MRQELLEAAMKLRHELHRHPELSGKEEETKRRLIEFLQEHTGLQIVDKGLWFYAVYKSAYYRDAIGFRADMDAIRVDENDALPYHSCNPGVAHKCGHDGHSAALAAFATEVFEQGCDRTVYFIFQHGEENGSGAIEACKVMEEEQIHEIYAVHNYPGRPLGAINTRVGTVCCASKGMELVFTGKPSHASEPEKGINPSGAISKLVLSIDNLVKNPDYRGLVLATVVQIDVGEAAFGVSAHKGKLLLTVRGEYEAEFSHLSQAIEAEAVKLAEEAELELEISDHDVFPDTSNASEAVEKIRQVCGSNGWDFCQMEEPLRTSEDFGYFLKKAPGALVWMGSGEEQASLHSEGFDYPDELMEKTAEFFWALLKE